jgi:DNA-binding transcriptional MerR regulator
MTVTGKEPLYTIGEVARLTGVTVKTIRFYADSRILPPARTTEARYRLFSTNDIWRLQMIRVLRQLGFGLESIRAIMAGELELGETLDWQLAALDRQLAQLGRIRAILQQAREQQGGPTDREISLELLQQLGMALGDNSLERHRFLADKLRAMVVGAVPAAPPEWQAVLLASFDRIEFPAELNAEQARAWAELIQLLNDPTFTDEARYANTHFWQTERQPEVSLEWYNEQMSALLNRAQALANEEVAAASPAAMALAGDWAEFATLTQDKPVTPEFLRELAEVTPRLFQKRVQRFWDLIALLSGRQGYPSYERAFEMLGAALREKLERILKTGGLPS